MPSTTAPTMQAVTARTYGGPDVLRIEQLEIPVPRDNEIRIRVHAATVSTTDNSARSGSPSFSRLAFGLRRPKAPVLGTEFAGTVDAVGRDVSRYRHARSGVVHGGLRIASGFAGAPGPPSTSIVARRVAIAPGARVPRGG